MIVSFLFQAADTVLKVNKLTFSFWFMMLALLSLIGSFLLQEIIFLDAARKLKVGFLQLFSTLYSFC